MRDLIDECGQDLASMGYKCKEEKNFGLQICHMKIKDKRQSELTGFEEGDYYIINSKNLLFGESVCLESISKKVEGLLKKMFKEASLSNKSNFLIIGLGNPNILADCLGPKVLEQVNIWTYKKKTRVYKFAPNIFANTGIDAFDIVGMLAIWLDVDGVIIIDSLATECISRVGCSIQINTAGITPGSAVNNYGKKIGKDTLGIPCISIGVPLMFFGERVGKDILLTPKDIHQNVDDLAFVIGTAINRAINK